MLLDAIRTRSVGPDVVAKHRYFRNLIDVQSKLPSSSFPTGFLFARNYTVTGTIMVIPRVHPLAYEPLC